MLIRQSTIENRKLKAFTHIELSVVRKGFTLIELLVVIAIISLLVSILLPSLTRAKNLAKRVICASNLRNTGTALLTYANANDGGLPRRENWSNLYRKGSEETGWEYVNCGLLIDGNYLPLDLLYCPASDLKLVTDWSWPAQGIYPQYWYLQQSSGYWQDKKISLLNLWTTVLMTDYMMAGSSHVGGFYHGKEGLNALFVDNSARWVADDELYETTWDFLGDPHGGIWACWDLLEEAY
jgi:prepilin-type N-terminal cleavage/methylation domain-containing protein